jgi:hypothetical protein
VSPEHPKVVHPCGSRRGSQGLVPQRPLLRAMRALSSTAEVACSPVASVDAYLSVHGADEFGHLVDADHRAQVRVGVQLSRADLH